MDSEFYHFLIKNMLEKVNSWFESRRKENSSSLDLYENILVHLHSPVHEHWALVVIRKSLGIFTVLDSIPDLDAFADAPVELKSWLSQIPQVKQCSSWWPYTWNIDKNKRKPAEQPNNRDCGACTCINAAFAASDGFDFQSGQKFPISSWACKKPWNPEGGYEYHRLHRHSNKVTVFQKFICAPLWMCRRLLSDNLCAGKVSMEQAAYALLISCSAVLTIRLFRDLWQFGQPWHHFAGFFVNKIV